MTEHDPADYGRQWAADYDDLFESRDDLDLVCDRLVALSGGGPILEFGIGTGRLAAPLAARGIEVHGIDASPEMLDRLRSRPGSERISAVLGDMSSTRVTGEFALVLIAFSTLYLLVDQEAQVRCIANAAAHLRRGGRLVVEAFVPDPGRYTRGGFLMARDVGPDFVELEAARHDRASQVVESRHVVIRQRGTTVRPTRLRYVWPAELDLMARLAGFRLVDRSSGWDGRAYDAAAEQHVSVYELG